MLKNLKLTNFRTHRQTELEFAPGLTVIIGDSDCGKTNIIRALKWLVWNRPLGEGMLSWNLPDGEPRCVKVDATFDDCRVTREIYNGANLYYLNDIDMTGFGASVPEVVSQALNMTEVNLQQQLAPSFLLNNSSGEVARFFNKIARLQEIDRSTKNLNRWHMRIKSDLNHAQQEVEKLQEEIEDLDYLVEMEIDVQQVERWSKEIDSLNSRHHRLFHLVWDIDRYKRSIDEAHYLVELADEVDELNTIAETLTYEQDRYDRLRLLCHKIGRAANAKIEYQLKQYDVSKIESLFRQYKRYEEISNRCNDLTSLLQSISKLKNLAEDYRKQALAEELAFARLMPPTCPLCGK